MTDNEKMQAAIKATTDVFLGMRLTGRECSVVLFTLVAHMLASNSTKVTRQLLDSLRADINHRRRNNANNK